ncbi:MAG: hypothetical protein HC824_21780, partial [Synechococcales cyanobacterium RM1_1_8]|nr:hypothetical protein [Synechococcales cyanobacterium RM1_1_8]
MTQNLAEGPRQTLESPAVTGPGKWGPGKWGRGKWGPVSTGLLAAAWRAEGG